VKISYPTHLLAGSIQNLSITFRDESFSLQDVSLTIHSRLSVHAIKRTFTVEEEADVISSNITEDNGATKVLSIQTPIHLTESFALSLKKSVVRKSESIHLLFSYSKEKSTDKTVYCTVNRALLQGLTLLVCLRASYTCG